MPRYDYRCFTCNITTTVTRGVEDEDLHPECPACQKPMMRLFTAPGVTFNGSGWGKDSW